MAEKADYQEILKGILVMIETSGVDSDEPVKTDQPGKVKQLNELVDDIYGYVEKALSA